VRGSGPVAEGILKVANEHDSGLILMGGYGRQPVVDAVVGSTVDRILRQSARPTLICR
jgi:nucleotide-binding universal stress UspA family protein